MYRDLEHIHLQKKATAIATPLFNLPKNQQKNAALDSNVIKVITVHH